MTDELRFTVGDTPTLTGTVNANASGASAEAHVKRPDDQVITHTVEFTDAPTGAWSCDLIADDLSIPGGYRIEVQVTFIGGQIQTFSRDPQSNLPVEFQVDQQIA